MSEQTNQKNSIEQWSPHNTPLRLLFHELPRELRPPEIVLGLLRRPRAAQIVEGQAVVAMEDTVHDLDASGARIPSHVMAPQSIAAVVRGVVRPTLAGAVAGPEVHEVLLSQIEETVFATHALVIGTGVDVVAATSWVDSGRGGPSHVRAEAVFVDGDA